MCQHFVCDFLNTLEHADKFLLKNPRVLYAVVKILLMWIFHLKSSVIVTTRYFFSRTVLSSVYEKKESHRKVQGMPQSQTAANPRYQEEEKKDKNIHAQNMRHVSFLVSFLVSGKLHLVASDGLKPHTAFPSPTNQSVYISLKFCRIINMFSFPYFGLNPSEMSFRYIREPQRVENSTLWYGWDEYPRFGPSRPINREQIYYPLPEC